MCAGSLCFCFISQDLGAWGETLRPPPHPQNPFLPPGSCRLRGSLGTDCVPRFRSSVVALSPYPPPEPYSRGIPHTPSPWARALTSAFLPAPGSRRI